MLGAIQFIATARKDTVIFDAVTVPFASSLPSSAISAFCPKVGTHSPVYSDHDEWTCNVSVVLKHDNVLKSLEKHVWHL